MKVWVVRYGNYAPMQIDSLHQTEDAARQRAAELEGVATWAPPDWRVQLIEVK